MVPSGVPHFDDSKQWFLNNMEFPYSSQKYKEFPFPTINDIEAFLVAAEYHVPRDTLKVYTWKFMILNSNKIKNFFNNNGNSKINMTKNPELSIPTLYFAPFLHQGLVKISWLDYKKHCLERIDQIFSFSKLSYFKQVPTPEIDLIKIRNSPQITVFNILPKKLYDTILNLLKNLKLNEINKIEEEWMNDQ